MKKIDLTEIAVQGTEWFSSLAILNLCWLLFSLPIITLIPATDALFTVLNQWQVEEKRGKIFANFKYYFKRNFKSSFKLGLPWMIIIVVLGLDIVFLNQQMNLSAGFQVFKYAFYTLTLIFSGILLYIYPLAKQLGFVQFRLVFTSMLLVFNYPLVTLGLLISCGALLLLFSYWPAMLFFFSMSSFAWLATTATSYALKKNEEKNE